MKQIVSTSPMSAIGTSCGGGWFFKALLESLSRRNKETLNQRWVHTSGRTAAMSERTAATDSLET